MLDNATAPVIFQKTFAGFELYYPLYTGSILYHSII